MNSSLYVIFNETKKNCLLCSYLKSFNPNASEDYKNSVINCLKNICGWKIPEDLEEKKAKLIIKYKTIASEGLAKCGAECLNGTPAVAKYLEEKINTSESPKVVSIPLGN